MSLIEPGLVMICRLIASDRSLTTSAFYKGESQEKKFLWRLEGAKMFAVLSSPCRVGSLRGFVWL